MKDIALKFVIAGAPKCGTTSLAAALDLHSKIEMSEPKETFHFNPEFLSRKTHDDKDYASHFSTSKPVRGDGSIWSMYGPSFLDRLTAMSDRPLVLLVLRSPEQFVSSLYHYNIDKGYENAKSVEEALKLENDRYNGRRVPRGCPHPRYLFYRNLAQFRIWIEPIIARLGRASLCVFDLDAQSNEALLREAQAFLNVEEERIIMPRLNPGSYDASAFNRLLLSRVVRALRGARGIGLPLPHTGIINHFRTVRSKQLKVFKARELDTLRDLLSAEIADFQRLMIELGPNVV